MPYALGRPLGAADDPEFQTAVIKASLNMLYTATEPTIEDYPVEIPPEAGPGQWSCPLTIAPPEGDDSLKARLLAEVARLRPWSTETRRTRGRTLFGASGATSEQVDVVAEALAMIAENGDVNAIPDSGDMGPVNAKVKIDWTVDQPLLIRHLADDLRTFYHEAIAAQPGPGAPNHDALNEWIFGGTALGETLLVLAEHLTADGSPVALLVRGLLIPEGHYHGGSAFPASAEFGAESR